MSPVAQPSLPLGKVSVDEIARKRSFGDAIGLAAEIAGFDFDKQESANACMDKGQWSRIKSGQEGIKWERLSLFLDRVGNDVPLLWMLHMRGYDISTVRKRESENERRIRELEEKLEAERMRSRVLSEALSGRVNP
ncbi:hypothetical protein [Tahibacter harae]|uniref:Bacteriophage CI repressor-like protein n=1 Tax=Tahibacter harae TaxID=2963937 RepID=A0ABT1QS46_9GAMM|nr:hypothetical protein [Tahibacter harae]MCQ4165118.1 hypothetical protein [Tahibacter harae]